MKFAFIAMLLLMGCSTQKEVTVATEQKAAEKVLMFDGHCPNGLCLKKMVKGQPDFKLEIGNKIYHFSSQKALDQFKIDLEANLKKAENHWQNMPDRK